MKISRREFLPAGLMAGAGPSAVSPVASAPQAAASKAEVALVEAKRQFTLRNSRISRTLQIGKGGFYTVGFRNLATGVEYSRPLSEEFAFALDGTRVTAAESAGLFDYSEHTVTGDDSARTLCVELRGVAGKAADGIAVRVFYRIYSDVAVIQKWIEVVNTGSRERRLEDLEWESVNLSAGSMAYSSVYSGYGHRLMRVPYEGGPEDLAVAILYSKGDSFPMNAMVVGNEAPSVLKSIRFGGDVARVSIGMARHDAEMPFRAYLKPGSHFTSPRGFLLPCRVNSAQEAFEGDFATFIRRHLGVKLFEREKPPMFVYSPYIPFRSDFSEGLYHQLIDAAADCGVDYFQVTWAWSDDLDPHDGSTVQGDYQVSPVKFPHGLGPVTEHIRKRGMKPCLYFSLANMDRRGRVYHEHPEWAVTGADGKPVSLHGTAPGNAGTMCLASGWYDYILERISHYVSHYGIEWLMLDLSAVTSAYIVDKTRTGCCSKGHDHKDREESLYMIYERLIRLFDTLKSRFPGLYIDCTFELWGYMHITDYSLIEHADGNWISNLTSVLEARQLRYDRASVLPPSTFVVGNLRADDQDARRSFASLVPATVVMLGDLRKVAAPERAWFKQRTAWLAQMERKYQYSRFYQVGDVFGRPTASGWDGCARFNTERDGGLLCVYRNDSPESSRTFPLPWVKKESRYTIRADWGRKYLGSFSGETLQRDGLRVDLAARNQSDVLEIEAVSK